MLFTLLGQIYIDDVLIDEKTAVKLTDGCLIEIVSGNNKAQVLFISSDELKEPVAWGGPIVMNTRNELYTAFEELNNGTFIKQKIEY